MTGVTRREIEDTVEIAGSRLYLRGRDLRGVDLSGLDLDGADLQDADLEGADLSSMSLQGSNLARANLRGVRLDEAKLDGATLDGADLTGVDLSGRRIRRVGLRDAILIGANLEGADLEDLTLQSTNLCGANLVGANLTDANLDEADLRGANLVDAKLRQVSFGGTKYDADTKWPAGFDISLVDVPASDQFDAGDGAAGQQGVTRRWSYLEVFVGRSGWVDSAGRRGRQPAPVGYVEPIPIAWICNRLDAEGWELLTVTAQAFNGTRESYAAQCVDQLTILFRREFQTGR